MISISSSFPVLPAQDSLYYELLALTAICGELPCACADRLTSSKSYRKKVVTSLTHDKLLRIFSKDHLRGYRLGIRGKRLLRERAPERFQFYLSGRTDTNSIKSSPARRLRLHRIAQTYVTMMNAGAVIYRDEKPPILAHHALHSVQTQLGMNRDQSYRWLQTQMGLPGDQVHIAKCGDYRCEQIIRICENATAR